MEPCGRPEHRGMGNTSLMFGLYREGEYRGEASQQPQGDHRSLGLERFVSRESLQRVHECIYGVMALETQPVDPRL